MHISLNKLQWKLKGYWPYIPLFGKSMELGNELMGVTEWIDAEIPGGVHYDLMRAGLIENPYYELNSLKCEWVENRWWVYKTTFLADTILQNKSMELVFKGVDYKAYFYLNGEKLGEHEGMFEAVRFDITGKVKFGANNELAVAIENAPQEMSQIGYTSRVSTQKCRFNYNWDFSTRLVNIGLWDDIMIRVTGDVKLENTCVIGHVENDIGIISISAEICGTIHDNCQVKVCIKMNGSCIHSMEEYALLTENVVKCQKNFIIDDPLLWYPNGTGEQPLYCVRIQVFKNGSLSDEKEYLTGIRKIEYRRNEGSSEDSLPYTVLINKLPVYIKGVNLTPFDMLYGNVTREDYEKYLFLLKSANVNLVRVWGGGIIEKEYFYHLCDLHGIMVWQEFIQSGSGIDNKPCEDTSFLKLLKATAINAVKEKRNHVCHSFWSGGNELMDEAGVPVTSDNANIQMLREIVNEYDAGKLFLPTSASGPNEFLNIQQPGKNHDVHGGWKYGGICNHYDTYNKSDSLLHSEFGMDGCSSMETLKKILSPDNLVVTDAKINPVWRHHGEWWDTLERDEEIFGKFTSLDQFVAASQLIQAEGLRYIVEANRRRKFNNSGSIVWQFNEPWPNTSCTSLVDYYGMPKMAYYWLRMAYSPVHASLAYDKLSYRPGEEFHGRMFVHNSLAMQALMICYEVLDVKGRVYKCDIISVNASDNCSFKLADIILKMPETKEGVFFIRLKIYDECGNVICENLYIFSQLETEIFKPLLKLQCKKPEFEKVPGGYKVKNEAFIACLFLHGVNTDGKSGFIIENNYTSLFPGEEKVFKVIPSGSEKGFDKDSISFEWRYFNMYTD